MTIDLDDIKTTDPQLVMAYKAFTTRIQADESFAFWFDKGNNEGRYHQYIKKGSPKQINIDDAMVKKFDKLAATGSYSGMSKLFTEAREQVKGMLQPRTARSVA